MPVIVVGQPQGRGRKSTPATNLGGTWRARTRPSFWAMWTASNRRVAGSALRPAGLPAIATWQVQHGDVVRPPTGTTHAVLDTPVGLHGKRLL